MLEGDFEDEGGAKQFVWTGDLKVPGPGKRLLLYAIHPGSVEVICQSHSEQIS